MKLLMPFTLAALSIAAPTASGLVKVQNYYRLGDGDPSSTGTASSAKDSSGTTNLNIAGTANYSTDVGPEAAGRTYSSRSIDFGTSSFAYGPVLSTATDNFGLEMWVKPGSSSGTHYLAYNGDTGSNGWGILQDGGSFQALFGGVAFFGGGSAEVGIWTHVALVRNSGNATLYVNGAAVGSSSLSPNAANGNFSISAPPPDLNRQYLNGLADEVRIFTFTPGQFTTADLLLRASEIEMEQPAGTPLASGASRAFGSVAPGSEAKLAFTIRNTGLFPLTVDGTPAVSFTGPQAADYSVVAQPLLPDITPANEGFETPAYASGEWYYSAGSDWNFGNRSGIARLGSPWFVKRPPDGNQSAFIQINEAGSFISKTVNFPAPGEYRICFSAVRRGTAYPANDLAVKVDGSTIGTVSHESQPDDTWRVFTVTYSCSSPGDHQLSFIGTRGDIDNASAIDDVRIFPSTTSFEVKFKPSANGPSQATMVIGNNDADENPYLINLSGSQMFPSIAVTLTSQGADVASRQLVQAIVDPNGNPSTVTFEYGTTTAYGSSVVVSTTAAGTDATLFETVLEGLSPATLYHYRVVASNIAGTVTGEDRSFTTRDDPFTVVAYYRMGDADGPYKQAAAAGSEMIALRDVVGGHDLPITTVPDPVITAHPVFTADVGTRPAAETGSSRALDFLGGKSYAYAPVFFSPGTNYGIEAWVRTPLSPPPGGHFVLFNGSDPGIGIVQSEQGYQGYWTSGFVEGIGLAPAIPGEWIHLAVVHQNGKATFYVNGVATGSTVRPADTRTHTGSFWIGKRNHYDFRWSGQIDEVRLFTFPAGQFDPSKLLIKSIPPFVSQPTATSVTTTSAVLGGKVTSQGGTPVTERGVVYSPSLVNGEPSIGGTGVVKCIAPGDYGVFTVPAGNLAPLTRYTYRPYAISTAGTIYGPFESFTTPAAEFTPVAWYRFGEDDPGAQIGSIAAATRDSIGTRHLTITGPPLYSADTPPGSSLALYFGGGSAHASGSSMEPMLTEDFGFEAWVKATTNSGRHWIFYNGITSSNGCGLFQDGSSYSVLCGGRVQFGGGTVAVNEWTHLAVVRVNGVTTLHVNGTPVASSTIPPNPGYGGFVVAGNPGNPSAERWFGAIDEIRVFAFPPGQFTPGDLLLQKPEITVMQLGGSEIADGGSSGFGSVAVGNSALADFKISNIGNSDLSGFVPSMEGSDAADFQLIALDPEALEAGGSKLFSVRFTPLSAGSKNALLRFTTNDPDENPFDILLTGIGTDPEISIEQPALTPIPDGGIKEFANTFVGSRQTLTFSVRNNGNIDLDLTGNPRVILGGANAGDFAVITQPLSPVAAGGTGRSFFGSDFETPALAAGDFSYNSAGSDWTLEGRSGMAHNGSPWFVNPAPDGSQAAFIQRDSSTPGKISRSVNFPAPGSYVVRFQAVRRGPSNPAVDIDVAMDNSSIGSVPNGSQPDDTWRTFEFPYTCTAAGDHTLKFATPASSGDYASAIDRVQILSPTTFDVSFTPSARGIRTATLLIASNDRDEGSYEITLRGRGQELLPQIIVEQPAGNELANGGNRDFGTADVGTSTTLAFSIRNRGLAELLLSGTPPVAIGGTNGSDFSVTRQPVAAVPLFTPLSAGFETPALSTGGFLYGPGGTEWSYGSTSGVAHNGSPWYLNEAPQGSQAAFIQKNGPSGASGSRASRTIHFPSPGDYEIRFSLVRRSADFPGVDVEVKVDGTTIGTIPNSEQPDDTWRSFTLPYHCTTAGDQTLAFIGSRAEGGDFATAIDDLHIDAAATFEVKFTPSARGPRTATLTIPNNDPDQSPYTIALSGSGHSLYTPLEAWRLLHFGNADNSGDAADNGDPNHNGIPNLIEYALGGDPDGISTGILPQLARDGAGHPQLRFTRYLDRSDISLIVQGSNTLADPWTDLASSINGAAFTPTDSGASVSESGSGNTRDVTVTDSASPSSAAKRFLRLKVTNP